MRNLHGADRLPCMGLGRALRQSGSACHNLKRDNELESEIIARASEWWNKHIVADVPPEPTCEADIKRFYPSDNGAVVEWRRIRRRSN